MKFTNEMLHQIQQIRSIAGDIAAYDPSGDEGPYADAVAAIEHATGFLRNPEVCPELDPAEQVSECLMSLARAARAVRRSIPSSPPLNPAGGSIARFERSICPHCHEPRHLVVFRRVRLNYTFDEGKGLYTEPIDLVPRSAWIESELELDENILAIRHVCVNPACAHNASETMFDV